MIRHILLFKFKENTPREAISKIMDKFNECKEKISGLKSIQSGENISSKKHLSQGFTYCVIMTFESQDELLGYNKLDEHKEAQELQKPYVEEILVFDVDV